MVAFALAWLLPFWRAARLRWLLPAGTHLPTGTLWRIVAEALLWAFVLPLKLGELGLPLLLHRRLRLSLAAAAGLFLLVRLADLLVLAGVLALGLAATDLLASRPASRLLAAVAGAVLLCGPLFLVLVARRVPASGLELRPRLRDLLAGARAARGWRGAVTLLLTSWGLWATHLALAAAAVAAAGAVAPAGDVVLAAAAGNLAFALPVSGVLGLGPQQVAFATALDLGGMAWERAVVAALTTYVVVLAGALGTGLAAWLWGAVAGATAKSARKP